VSVFCIFAFAATTTVPALQTITYDKDYQFEFPREELLRRLLKLELRSLSVEHQPDTDVYSARLDGAICSSSGGRIKMIPRAPGEGKSTIQLETIDYNCDSRLPGDQQKLLEEFERRVVDGLRSDTFTGTRIRGTIYDDKHKPAALTDVALISLRDRGQQLQSLSITDIDGSFEFEGFPPGTYVLSVGHAYGVYSSAPFDQRFYPGVPLLERAEKIVVNGPVDLDNLRFQLGPRHTTRLIRVSAVWEDGRPVTNGTVWCSTGSDSVIANTDLQGKTTCDVLADREYRVTVGRLTWTGSDVPAKNVQGIAIAPDSKTVDLTIQVPLTNFDRTQQPANPLFSGRKPSKGQ